ncbi:MAG: hypothetical protein R3C00_03305 [Hyphomonas sp.]|nr:hypothetical protein [Hyphomonas sp.]
MRWIFVVLATFAVACSGANGAPQRNVFQPVSQSDFTDDVIVALQDGGDVGCVKRLDAGGIQFGPDEDDCEAYALYTDNTYAKYIQEPERKDELIARLAAAGRALVKQGEDAFGLPDDYREALVVILRQKDYGTVETGGKAPLLVTRPFAGDLNMLLALDSATTLKPVTTELISASGLAVDELYDLAFANTRKRMGELEIAQDEGVEIVYAGTGLATGHLALPESCDMDTAPYYALVLDRDTYARAPDKPAGGARRLAEAARDIRATPNGFSSSLIHCSGGEWLAVDAARVLE